MWAGEWVQGGPSPTPFRLFPPTVSRQILVAGASVARPPPPPDFSSVFLFSAHRGHLRRGPAGGGAPASAAPHSQGGPGAACQQVSVVKGPGKRPRACPPALVPLQGGGCLGISSWSAIRTTSSRERHSRSGTSVQRPGPDL